MAIAQPKRPALNSAAVGGQVALGSAAEKFAGTGNVAWVHAPAVPAGHPVSVAEAVNCAIALMSASDDCDHAAVPMPASRDASAATPALEAELQSKLSWVEPAVTPTMKVPTTSPVPAETVTLHGAVEVVCEMEDASAAGAAPSARPASERASAAASATGPRAVPTNRYESSCASGSTFQ